MYKNGDKDGAENILKKCAAKFTISFETKDSFLCFYAMIFVDLFVQ